MAHFVLGDVFFNQQLNNLRHQLLQVLAPLNAPLLTARDSQHDVNTEMRPKLGGADYVAVGSMYLALSKHDTVVVGLKMLRWLWSALL